MEKLETVPRPYYESTVHQWIKHVLTIEKKKYVSIMTHECGFCQYVREATPEAEEALCNPCPAFSPCDIDPGYWHDFCDANRKGDFDACLEIALRVLEWLHDFEKAGKVTEVEA